MSKSGPGEGAGGPGGGGEAAQGEQPRDATKPQPGKAGLQGAPPGRGWGRAGGVTCTLLPPLPPGRLGLALREKAEK